jgi:hypothetical protein
VTHSALLAQLNTLTKELHGLRATNAALQEENEGWEYLLRERTLNGKVLEAGLLSREMSVEEPLDANELRRSRTSELEALDEELEMDELHSDLEAQSPIFDEKHDHEFARDINEYQLSTSPERGHLVPPRKGRKSNKKGNLSGARNAGIGLDLATELGRAEEVPGGAEVTPGYEGESE